MHGWGEAVTSTCYILVEIPESNVPLGRTGLTWEDTAKTEVKGIWCEDLYWIHLAQGTPQWRDLINLQLPKRGL
jgi:hypothetical protein